MAEALSWADAPDPAGRLEPGNYTGLASAAIAALDAVRARSSQGETCGECEMVEGHAEWCSLGRRSSQGEDHRPDPQNPDEAGDWYATSSQGEDYEAKTDAQGFLLDALKYLRGARPDIVGSPWYIEAEKACYSRPQGESHEAGIEAAARALKSPREFISRKAAAEEAIAAYLSRVSSPERGTVRLMSVLAFVEDMPSEYTPRDVAAEILAEFGADHPEKDPERDTVKLAEALREFDAAWSEHFQMAVRGGMSSDTTRRRLEETRDRLLTEFGADRPEG